MKIPVGSSSLFAIIGASTVAATAVAAALTGENLERDAQLLIEAAAGEPGRLPAAAHADLVERVRTHEGEGVRAVLGAARALAVLERPAVRDAIDRVSAQRYGWVSGLFWHTDLESAQRSAEREGKPILSLRLLGDLRDELSCANSRFFRTVLYADPRVSEALTERFVLHWSSERPAPVVSIDFGNGRKLRTTITGNSIHYVLDQTGQVIDALPGLVTPEVFGAWANDAAIRHNPVRGLGDPSVQYRRRLLGELTAPAMVSASSARPFFGSLYAATQVDALGLRPLVPNTAVVGPIRAEVAMELTISKGVMEAPMLRKLDPAWVPIRDGAPVIEAPVKGDAPVPVTLPEITLELMRTENPRADEKTLARMATSFAQTLALDTLRNTLQLRPAVLRLIVGGMTDFDTLNGAVYQSVLMTPRSDPTLGLFDAGRYTGIESGGLSGPR